MQERIEGYFGEGVEWCGDIPEKNEIVWYRRFWVKRPDDTPTVIHHLKPYAYNAVLFKKDSLLAALGKIFVSADPEMGCPLPVYQPTRHTWVPTGSCR